MIISCPYCQTRYQVAAEAIGSAGRKVQCANCQRAWRASPALPPDADLDAMDEEAMDASFTSVEDDAGRGKVVAMPGTTANAALPTQPEIISRVAAAMAAASGGEGGRESAAQRIAEYARHQKALQSGLPTARFKRILRLVAALLFVGLIGGLAVGREQIVRQVPEMAGLYQVIGLPVNVVGLELSHLRSVAALREGQEVLEVKAEIANVAGRLVPVPPVIVTVRDAEERPLYEWSIAPPVASLGRDETVGFEARLAQPPPEAVSVRLSFASGRPAATTTPTAVHSPSSPAPAPKDAH